MQVTSVSVRKIEKEGSRMRGIASIVLDDSFAVHDIRIIEGDEIKKGYVYDYFVALDGEGKFAEMEGPFLWPIF